MKKKLVITMLASAMMLFAACGNSEGKTVPTPTTQAKPTEVAAATATPAGEPTLEPTATTAPTATPTPEPTATATPIPEPTKAAESAVTDTYAKGKITENGFESEWMNLRFTTPPWVTMMSEENLNMLAKQSITAMYGEEVAAEPDYTKHPLVMEMMAQYSNGTNVIVQVELLTALTSGFSEEEYLSMLVYSLQNSGNAAEIQTDEKVLTVEIGGNTYTAMGVVADYGTGIAVCQDYLVRKVGNRMITIAVSYSENTVTDAEQLLEAFGSFDSAPIVYEEITMDTVGITTETGYENESIGIRFALPENAVFAEDSETLMTAQWNDNSATAQLMLEKASYENMTAEEYTAEMKNELQSLAAYGMNYVMPEELALEEIGGQQYIKLAASIEAEGKKVYQDFYVREQDGVMVVLALSYSNEGKEQQQKLLNGFSAY